MLGIACIDLLALPPLTSPKCAFCSRTTPKGLLKRVDICSLAAKSATASAASLATLNPLISPASATGCPVRSTRSTARAFEDTKNSSTFAVIRSRVSLFSVAPRTKRTAFGRSQQRAGFTGTVASHTRHRESAWSRVASVGSGGALLYEFKRGHTTETLCIHRHQAETKEHRRREAAVTQSRGTSRPLASAPPKAPAFPAAGCRLWTGTISLAVKTPRPS